MRYVSILLFISSGMGQALASQEIIGGKLVDRNDLVARSTVALVAFSNQGESLCTASIVDEDLAITAAHCVQGDRLVLVFSTRISDANRSQMREVVGIRTPNGEHDIAMIRFSGGVPAGYVPAPLLPLDQTLKNGEIALLAGYGITDAIANTGEGTLRKVETPILDPGNEKTEVVLDQRSGGGACHGDSGGPAYVVRRGSLYVFGVTSRGTGNCDEFVIYTRLSAFAKWLERAAVELR